MKAFRTATASEQVADYLREQLKQKVWQGMMPGGELLSRELGVGRMTVEAALATLESEGLLVPQGARKRRKIVLPESMARGKRLRISFMLYEKGDLNLDFMVDLRPKLEAGGHVVSVDPIFLSEINMSVRRVSSLVRKQAADAWVAAAGSSEILEWFIKQKIPCFAISGRRHGLRIAGIGPSIVPSVTELTNHLIDLGHTRISFLDSSLSIEKPYKTGGAFLDVMRSRGIPVGPFNLPGWEGGAAGFHDCLDSLFRLTPPTALITASGNEYLTAIHFLMNRGMRVPDDVSIHCNQETAYFKDCQPSVSHITHDLRPISRRVLQWVDHLSHGKTDLRQGDTRSKLVHGGTVGPAPKASMDHG